MKTSITALVFATLMIAGPANAATFIDLASHGIDTASAMLSVDNGIATLTGDVNGIYEREALERVVLDFEGVEKVKNFLQY